MTMLTDFQKTLLAIQHNLDQLRAAIRQGMHHPECDQDTGLVLIDMSELADEVHAIVEDALESRRT
jgi:hypothetical protein